MSQQYEAPASVLPVGTTLQMGKYRVVRFIASGGFGNTYEVVNVEFEECMAMKEFFMRGVNERDDDSMSVSVSNAENKGLFEAQKNKLKKEARRLRKLHNQYIVKVHDLFEENGTVYYVMDYIDGESLSTRIKRTGKPLPEHEVWNILPQLLAALDEVHGNGIWHLDIKPANIMISSLGKALLIDFGASKQLSSSEGFSVSTSTAMCYTPGYAPMEQIEQDFEKFGPWTDFYALGATLYNLLTTNKPPSSSEISEGDAFAFPPSVSPRMRRLVEWLMQPARRKRPQSVFDIREFIKLIKDGPETEEEDESTVYANSSHIENPTTQPNKKKQQTKRKYDEAESSAEQKQRIIDNIVNNMVYVEGGALYDGPAPIILSSYYIGKYEVTQAEWKAVMGSNPSYFKGDNLPVENVSWNDCQEFIRKLNSLTDKKFRLPTEAEWEFAARGGNNSREYQYSGSNDINSVAWYKDNSGGKTHPVGNKSPNELGLYDMSGNVWEWSENWCGEPYEDEYLLYGNSFTADVRFCDVWNSRIGKPDERCNDFGFRLVLSPTVAVNADTNKNHSTPQQENIDDKPSNEKEINTGVKKMALMAGITIIIVLLVALLFNNIETNHIEDTDSITSATSIDNKSSSAERVLDNLIKNMVKVEGGTFTMGATPEQNSIGDSGKPAHRVTLSSYYIGKYEVTQAEWKAVMDSNPSYFKGDNLPVENVSWNDCQTFICKLNSLTGKNFRLPTEAEWEFAARGGNNSRSYKYSGSNDIGSVAWYDGNSGDKTHPVGQKSPNELGLYDMSGNVFEWCQDWYSDYTSSAQTNPIGPNSGKYRIYRGGCFGYEELDCCVSMRYGYASGKDCNLGLRLAL